MNQSTSKNQSIKTIPEGVWESSRPKDKESATKASITTDLQGNGYPKQREK